MENFTICKPRFSVNYHYSDGVITSEYISSKKILRAAVTSCSCSFDINGIVFDGYNTEEAVLSCIEEKLSKFRTMLLAR